VAGGAAFGWREFQARRDRAEALGLAQRGHFSDSEPLLKGVLERAPNDLEVIQALARGYIAIDNRPEAETYLGRWCALQPDVARPYQIRMEFWEGIEQWDRALADGQRVLELEPDNFPVQEQVVDFLVRLGRFPEAEQVCRRLLLEQPTHLALRYHLAESLAAQGATAEAEALLDALVREHPRFTAALMERAKLYHEVNQPGRAIPLLKQVLAVDPHHHHAYHYLGLSLARTGQAEEAQRVMAKLRQLLDTERLFLNSRDQPHNLGLQVRVAEALFEIGKTQGALSVLEKVLKRDPKFAPAHQLLAAYHDRQGQINRAAEHRRRAAR
jgi:predicted Zn-dependent protease